MMVVNATFEPGLFYDQIVDGLCESTQYEFTADVLNIIRTEVADHLLPNVSFLIDDKELFSTGAIPQSETWETFGFTFTTDPGQNSIRLSLRNNAPGGFGNDLALDNITFRACGPEAFILPMSVANICEDGNPIALDVTVLGDQYDTPVYQWQRSLDAGLTWEDIPGAADSSYLHTELSSGFYHYRFLLANDPANLSNARCRVSSTIKIVHVVPKFFAIRDTICEGLFSLLGSDSYNKTGTYIDSFISSIGCDSIVTLELQVIPDPLIQVDFSAMDQSCHDITDGSFTIDHVENGVAPFEVYVDGTVLNNSMLENLEAGTFDLLVVDRYGCSLADSFSIMAPEAFVVDLGPDTILFLGTELEILAQVSDLVQSYEWSSNPNEVCIQDCAGIRFTPIQDQVIELTAISVDGCRSTDTIAIRILKDVRMYFPNAFSPNGDGINDRFNGQSNRLGIETIDRFSIFNRWGSLVWSGTNILPDDPLVGWDGTIGDSRAPTGTYVFVAEVRLLDHSIMSFSGGVLLLR